MAEDWKEEIDGMDLPPDERASHAYGREPGQFKRTRFGFIDPTPDVVSLQHLPKDDYGFVDWMKALREGLIAPRDYITRDEGKEEPRLDVRDVVIKSKLEFMPDVLFPHSAHADWLKCSVCHPKIFKDKAGENPISMIAIWKGEYCGRCHDRVAFPIRNCFKCHSLKRVKK
jgi:c(7)-type cytochrome triheme protein